VISSIALCSHLARMIQQEDPANPHADQDLVNLIYAKLGITVARRTVANYRKAQGIPISGRRKRRSLPKHLPRSN
jgi:RNA polymerase sigma-54 factor